MEKLPRFVKMKNTALRLIGEKYYRDGGDWSVGYKIIDGVLLSWAEDMGMPWLHKQPLIEITEAEWRIDNAQYAPDVVQHDQVTHVNPDSSDTASSSVSLPCPFCGCGENPVKKNTRLFYTSKGSLKEVDYYLECNGCGLVIGNDNIPDQWGDVVCDYSTPEEALKVWNTRHVN